MSSLRAHLYLVGIQVFNVDVFPHLLDCSRLILSSVEGMAAQQIFKRVFRHFRFSKSCNSSFANINDDDYTVF